VPAFNVRETIAQSLEAIKAQETDMANPALAASIARLLKTQNFSGAALPAKAEDNLIAATALVSLFSTMQGDEGADSLSHRVLRALKTAVEQVVRELDEQAGSSARRDEEAMLLARAIPRERRLMTESDVLRHRAAEASAVLAVLARHGRRFFYSPSFDRVARLEVDARGRVVFIDDYTDRRVATHAKRDWPGFSHGGTLRSLVEALRDYIITGESVAAGHFGPWPDRREDLWAYGLDEMERVRADLRGSPAVEAG